MSDQTKQINVVEAMQMYRKYFAKPIDTIAASVVKSSNLMFQNSDVMIGISGVTLPDTDINKFEFIVGD